jgi:hypothetical protein
LILLNRKSIQNASCIPKESTRVSNALGALGASPTSANKENKKESQHKKNSFQQGIRHASYSNESSIGLTPGLTPNKD